MYDLLFLSYRSHLFEICLLLKSWLRIILQIRGGVPMPTTFRCQNCGMEKRANCRLKQQQYCGEKPCQRARRREYQKNRLQEDAAYGQKQADYRQAWRKKRSLAQYQRSYRESHPDYVKRNRERQRQRNEKRCGRGAQPRHPVIVKMNSCSSIKSGTYLLTPCQVNASEVIVKMNSCLVELSLFQQDVTWPSVRFT